MKAKYGHGDSFRLATVLFIFIAIRIGFIFFNQLTWHNIIYIFLNIKGHLEHNETKWDAAIRETEEESGIFLYQDFLSVDNSKKVESIYLYS